MTRRSLLALTAGTAAPRLRVGAFRADVTPPPGEPLIWTTPATEILDPLLAKGVVLEDGRARYVLCAVDWCGLGSSALEPFRRRIAAAARTDVSRVAVHTVHQHTAPYVDGDAYRLLDKLPQPPLRASERFLNGCAERIASAVEKAALQPFDSVGTGSAAVERVASARRLVVGGKIVPRYSTSGKDPSMAAAPEGAIDPLLRTVTLAAGDRSLVRLHYYATHPQTFCCDGRVSADFAGAARERLEREEGVPQIYFTGAAGDVTVGKYNDGSVAAREGLAARLLAGMRASIAASRFAPAARIGWRRREFTLPARAARLNDYRSAITVAFSRRAKPLEASALRIGDVAILHLPGEPLLEFQRFALSRGFFCLAGYGDISPGYLCTGEAFAQGGYEPSAANAGPGTERILKAVIMALS